LDGHEWAKGYINRCYEMGWINGVGGGRFAPGNNVTYAEAITILIRLSMRGNALSGAWPQNYIDYATMYHMTGSVSVTNWSVAATKGDIAILTFQIASPVYAQPVAAARFGNVNVAGTVGAAISENVTIRLESALFSHELVVGDDVAAWFDALPGGVRATVAIVPDSRSWVTILIDGAPSSSSSAVLRASIPGWALEGGGGLVTEHNADARFTIQ
jgi:hypothetical protein